MPEHPLQTSCISINKLETTFHHTPDSFYNVLLLDAGSIKVPQAYYGNYTETDALDDMVIPDDSREEKKAKFAKI